jgi:hypothetical protein
MKFSVTLAQLVIFTLAFNSLFAQYSYGFLKPSVSSFIIRDLNRQDNSDWSDTITIYQASYFSLLNTDSSKFQIQIAAFSYFGNDRSEPSVSNFTAYVDRSKIIQFDSLTDNEKKKRIMDAMDVYLKLWGKRSLNDKRYENTFSLFYEGTFSAMRQELIKYWEKNKEKQLLLKYFEIFNCCTGDDGLDSRAIGNIFCSAPQDFCNVLNERPKKFKDYMVYRLKNSGILYHIIYDTHPPEGTADEVVKGYENLLDSLVK